MSIKTERIASNLIREISYILANEIKDKDIKFVTITDVKVTSDLSFAKVYFTVLDDSKKESTTESLKNASKYIRKELAERVDIRHIPELQFVYDESIEYGNKIEKIIEKIHDN
ncbi:MAG: 30S ribosome-binding factor RbfA [Bacilli bacterium]|nr:30S ribosome-binding factor RbfA [Bacilli bacterium]